jgi:hypothetical protein
MFAHELHQVRSAELRRQAEEWRLVRDAKAARSAERRARTQAQRGQAPSAARKDAEGVPSPKHSGASLLGMLQRAPRPRGAA